MTSTIRADLRRELDPAARWQDTPWRWGGVLAALLDRPGLWAVLEYRLRRSIRARGRLAWVAAKPLTFLTRRVVEAITGITIDAAADIGPGFYIGHFGGIVVGGGVRAGQNLSVSQGVTLGDNRGSPTLGDQVYFAPGAKAFGPITIGDHVSVGANAVVHKDVPAWSTVVAAGTKVLEDRGNMRPAVA